MKVLGEKAIKIENIKEQKHLERIIKFIVGCFIVSVSYNLFLAPKDLVPGGVSGIATILNKCFGLNNSFIILLILRDKISSLSASPNNSIGRVSS